MVYTDGVEETKRTYPVEGNNPEWNETLEFLITSTTGKGFSSEELVNNTTMLYFSIFDEVENMEYNEITNAFTIKIDKRFLGSFSIPLSTVLQNPPRMEAMFKVNRPLSLFNYEILTQNIFLYSAEEQERK